MPEGPDEVSALRRRLLSVVAAGRVDAIVSLHTEMVGDAEDAYPAVQVVESCWREFGTLGDESHIRQAARPKVDELRAAAETSGLPISKEDLFQLRIGAGSDAMNYHRSLKVWMRQVQT